MANFYTRTSRDRDMWWPKFSSWLYVLETWYSDYSVDCAGLAKFHAMPTSDMVITGIDYKIGHFVAQFGTPSFQERR